MEGFNDFGSILEKLIQTSPYLAVFLIVLFLFRKPISEASDKHLGKMIALFLKRRNQEALKIIHLQHHPFFLFMQECLNRHIPQIYMKNRTKDVVLKEFLKIRFTVFYDNWSRLIELENVMEMDKSAFKHTVVTLFHVSIQQYRDLAIKRFMEIGLDGDTANYVLSQFDGVHDKTLDIISRNLEDVCDSDYPPNMNYRMNDTLLMLKVGFELTMKDGIEAFQAINGRLENASLKNHLKMMT